MVVGLEAYRRGHAHQGEPCDILGGGRVSVEWVKTLMADAFVKAVLHDGVQVQAVAHFGRHIRAHLRTALELGAPPGFEGAECCVPACARRYGLEWDHVNPMANKGVTSLGNLLCATARQAC